MESYSELINKARIDCTLTQNSEDAKIARRKELMKAYQARHYQKIKQDPIKQEKKRTETREGLRRGRTRGYKYTLSQEQKERKSELFKQKWYGSAEFRKERNKAVNTWWRKNRMLPFEAHMSTLPRLSKKVIRAMKKSRGVTED